LICSLEYLKLQRSEKTCPAERDLIATAIQVVDRDLLDYTDHVGSYAYLNMPGWTVLK
jgi:hypothetical protein